MSTAAATLWRQTELPSAPAPSSLASMAERAADSLRSAEQRVCCFESTTGGLIQASLLASPGASQVRAATGLPTHPIPASTLPAQILTSYQPVHDVRSSGLHIEPQRRRHRPERRAPSGRAAGRRGPPVETTGRRRVRRKQAGAGTGARSA
eukprot:scaffold134634_cov69-Phaeocystis_antarctica.AAC.2